jgi:hypothetical protein
MSYGYEDLRCIELDKNHFLWQVVVLGVLSLCVYNQRVH